MKPNLSIMEVLKLSTTHAAGQPTLPTYYFETETKRLKNYYQTNKHQLIGRRVLFNNSSGIVRYFGPLQHLQPNNPDELWVGVHWQQQGRGKHNGTVGGHTYFTCPHHQGSLLKYEKIEFGYRLEIALFKRYFKAEELHHAKDIFYSLKHTKLNPKSLKQSPTQSQQQSAQTLQHNVKQVDAPLHGNEALVHPQKQQGQKQNDKAGLHEKEENGEAQVKKVHKVEYDAEAYIGTVKASKKILIEFVGFDQIWTKINSLDKIQSISLAGCRICDLGPLGHVGGLLNNLKILSLEDNLISDWMQIYQLGYELPQLQELSVSYNAIHPPTQTFEALGQIQLTGRKEAIAVEGCEMFKNLRSLILIDTGLSWESLLKVAGAFKGVEDFILCKNDLSDTQHLTGQRLLLLKNARFLNLEEAQLSSFSSIEPLGSLPLLQKLILNRNKLGSIGWNIKGFKGLKHISVQHCELGQPVSLAEIGWLGVLESVNVKHNPMGEKFGNSYVRMRAVAEIPKLLMINGAELKKGERRDFEIYYLRESFREYFAVKKVPDYDYDMEDFLKYCQKQHPNIPRLIKRYGNPYEVEKKKEIQALIKEEVKVTENKKGTGMVEVELHYLETDSHDKKKVPLTWTVSTLKNFLVKTTKIPAGMLLVKVQAQPNAGWEEMTENHKTLSFYNLISGSRLTVQRA